MVKVFRCRDTGSNCDFVGRGATTAELVKVTVPHLHEAHGQPIDKKLETYVMATMKEELRR